MRKSIGLVTLLGLTGCGSYVPNSDDLQKALENKISGKGCATSFLFKSFPVDKSMAKTNRDVVDVFVGIGLVEQIDDNLVLTDQGKAFYDPSEKGFCYTSGYSVTNASIVSTESDLPSQVAGSWMVSFTVTPKDFSSWAADDRLAKNSSPNSDKSPSQSKEYKIRLIKKVGAKDLTVSDPRFTFNPNMNFNVGW